MAPAAPVSELANWLTSGYLADLWSFNSVWTYLQGPKSTGSNGIYGSLDVASVVTTPGKLRNYADSPGSRSAGMTWQNSAGFWLFGGNGFDSYSAQGSGHFS